MYESLDDKFNADILLFALSTCGMCRGVKKLLNEMKVEYDYIDVDLLSGDEKERAKKEMLKWNARCPFPMLIIHNSHCVIGDEPEKIREALRQ